MQGSKLDIASPLSWITVIYIYPVGITCREGDVHLCTSMRHSSIAMYSMSDIDIIIIITHTRPILLVADNGHVNNIVCHTWFYTCMTVCIRVGI